MRSHAIVRGGRVVEVRRISPAERGRLEADGATVVGPCGHPAVPPPWRWDGSAVVADDKTAAELRAGRVAALSRGDMLKAIAGDEGAAAKIRAALA